MEQRTHLSIHPTLVGAVVDVSLGSATVTLVGSDVMAADERGLVHGGFTFGLADYAAMVAVNDPFVVLGAAESKFLAPVRVGQTMTALATVSGEKGRKRTVDVVVSVDGVDVMTGVFTAFVLDAHVLG
jgi:acyl-coenzyme A thioesterase PaaI-like protein